MATSSRCVPGVQRAPSYFVLKNSAVQGSCRP